MAKRSLANMSDKPLLLIDGDEMVFRACAAVEQEVRFNVILGEIDWKEPPIHILGSNPVQAREVLDEMLERFFERFESRDHLLCFSAPPNFRYSVWPDYKNNRAHSRKPLCFVELCEQVKRDFKCKSFPGLEADDVIGIIATSPSKRRKIIISQDKDFLTIPSQVWRQGELVNVTEAQADYYHMFQTLVGDTSDGYKGCPGVGKVKAEKLLASPDQYPGETYRDAMWREVVQQFEKAKLTEQDALTQARLARILRFSDWDNDKKEPILWSPS